MSRLKENIIGTKRGMLFVEKMVERLGNDYLYSCICDCGNVCIKRRTYLSRKMKGIKNCGCLYFYNGAKVSKDRLYRVYRHMLQRCHYAYKDRHKKYYQDKGIKVCDEWKNDFLKFKEWALANGYDYNAPQGKCTIDRINPNGDYEPTNCRWITKSENSSRVIRQAKKYTYNGETHSLKEWAKIKKWSLDCLYGRLHRVMSFEEAITTPFDNKHKIKEDLSE